MKKFLKRIVGIFLILILGYQQFSYADVIVDQPIDLFLPIAFLLGFIVVIILVVSAISFFILKSTVENGDMKEANTKKVNIFLNIIYMCIVSLFIIAHIYLWRKYEFSFIILLIPIVLFLISIIIRVFKHKKISYIICVITIAFICVITLWNIFSVKRIENYNDQFLQYIDGPAGAKSISNLQGLIETTINNNKNSRKVSIIYQDIKYTSYTSVDELNQLLTKVNANGKYDVDYNYDKNHDYITSIIIYPYRHIQFEVFSQAYQGKQRGATVRSLLQKVNNIIIYEPEVKLNIIYTASTDQTIKQTITVNSKASKQIENIFKEIVSSKTYKVEMEMDSSIYNIIITSIN